MISHVLGVGLGAWLSGVLGCVFVQSPHEMHPNIYITKKLI